MRINTPMIRRSVRRLLAHRFVDLRALAAKEWTVCPGEDRRIAPAVHFTGAMDKVTRLCNTRDRDSEMRLLNGGIIQDAPTQAFVIKNVDLVGAYLYSKAARLQPGYGQEAIVLKDFPPKRRMSRATLIANNSGSHYFGNFMWDDLPLAMLDENRENHISVVKKPYDHETGYREILGVPAAPMLQHARIDEMTIFSDFAQNRSKEARLRTLRARLRTNVGAAHANKGGVFIRRGRTGERRVMENEPEIENYLASQGFTIIDPSTLSASEIARQSLDARLVIGVEGSHLAHALYSISDDATFLVLQPPNRFSLAHKEFADRLGMRYSFLVGDQSPDGFAIRIDELEAMLDRLL